MSPVENLQRAGDTSHQTSPVSIRPCVDTTVLDQRAQTCSTPPTYIHRCASAPGKVIHGIGTFELPSWCLLKTLANAILSNQF